METAVDPRLSSLVGRVQVCEDRTMPGSTSGSHRYFVAIAAAPLVVVAFLIAFQLPPSGHGDRVVDLAGTWKMKSGHERGHADPLLADGDWQEIELPDGHRRSCGEGQSCWLRKRFQLAPLDAGENGFLVLPRARRSFARVYINGAFIGEQGVLGQRLELTAPEASGWEFDGRVLRGDGLDVVAVHLSWSRLGYHGMLDGGMYVGSAEVLKPHFTRRQAVSQAVGYGGLVACVLAALALGLLWLLRRERRDHYLPPLTLAASGAFYLMGESGLPISFWLDPAVTFHLFFVGVLVFAHQLVAFADRRCHGRETPIAKINLGVLIVGLLAGVLVPRGLSYFALQALHGYLLVMSGLLLVVAIRPPDEVETNAGRYAPWLWSLLGFVVLGAGLDFLAEWQVLPAFSLLPLGVANAGIMACAIAIAEGVERPTVTAEEEARVPAESAPADAGGEADEQVRAAEANWPVRVAEALRTPVDEVLEQVAVAQDEFEARTWAICSECQSGFAVDAPPADDEACAACGHIGGLRSETRWRLQGEAAAVAGALQSLHSSTLQVTGILQALGALQELDDDAIEFTRVPVPADSLMRKACRRVAELAERSSVTVQATDSAKTLYPLVDIERCVQVLTHLLTNAIQHSESGGRVDIAARAHGRRCRFTITDHGAGIAAKHQEIIFERFVRLVGARANGLGLGLTLAHRITEMHGGRIAVESEPGKGSTFSVDLPMSQIGAPDATQ